MKIYYRKDTGELIWNAGYNYHVDVNFDKDYEAVLPLNQYEKGVIGLIVLTDGKYSQDFAECSSYKVDIATKSLIFSYPDPNQPEVEQPHQQPLSEQIRALEESNATYMIDLDYRLSSIELGL